MLMKISELCIGGSYLIEPTLLSDERGFFARAWCQEEFAASGIDAKFVQANLSYTRVRGSVRGMHYQRPPSTEGKLVRCIRGSVMDVIADIRPGSESFLNHTAVELNEGNRRALFIPAGVAHGFQSLVDDVELFYEMTDFYQPQLADGFRWDDGLFGIQWPLEVTVMNDRDANYPDVADGSFECFRGTVPKRELPAS